MGSLETSFDQEFKTLTGHTPLSWQRRLFEKHFAAAAEGALPHALDIPTGLGKTSVMAIWLLARAQETIGVQGKTGPRGCRGI